MKSQPLHAETNRKCQKLEHEKWLIKHPQPGEQPLNVIFAHALIPDILKNSLLESTIYRPSSTQQMQRPTRDIHNYVSMTEHTQLAQNQRQSADHQLTLRSCNIESATHSST